MKTNKTKKETEILKKVSDKLGSFPLSKKITNKKENLRPKKTKSILEEVVSILNDRL